MNKSELRYKMKIKRKYLGEIVRLEADRAISEEFFAEYKNYGSFLVYNALPYEARTDLITDALLSAGKDVYLPRVEGDNMAMVKYTKNTPLKKGSFGVYEPEGQAFSGEVDVIVAPLLAVNGRGYRLGWGGGYYDRFFARNGGKRVGIGYAFQMEEFPEEEGDEPLNVFICERGIYRFEKQFG